MSLAPLFEPLELPRSGLRLANRLVMAPMPTFAAQTGGEASAAELAYYSRRAAGLGAAVTAGCAVSDDGVCLPGMWRCDSDALLPSLESVAAAIQPVARAVLQLCHGGADVAAFDGSVVRRWIDAFSAAARRARRAGFDAVEIHGGHGYLVQQFFSRKTNSRRWSWGGPSPGERARFPLALAEACLESSLSLWYRLDPEEAGPDGIAMEETLELAGALAGGGAEVFDVSAKRYAAGSLRDPEDRRPRADVLAASLGQRAAVMAVGGIEAPAEACEALAGGASLAGLGRVLLGEPDWALKTRNGDSSGLRLAPLSGDTLRNLAVPEPMIGYLARRGKLER